MGRGIANTGPTTLTSIRNAYSYGSVVRTDTYSTGGAQGTTTAPSDAVWCNIEIWGAGGGGRGFSTSADYGGGGGAYSQLLIPVVGGSTTFGYTIGTGGAGGAVGANGSPGGSSSSNTIFEFGVLFAWGGGAGSTVGTSRGGIAETNLGQHILNSTATVGGNSSTTLGGTAANGGAGGSSGVAGTAPGGGGGPGVTSGVAGGAGADGQVKFTWYGPSTANNLTYFYRGGSNVASPGAIGYNGFLPVSGDIKLTDFVGVDQIGFNGNTLPVGYSNLEFFSDVTVEGGSATSNAKVDISPTGRLLGSFTSGNFQVKQAWLQHLTSYADATIAGNFDVQFIKTAGTTPSGNSVNTWIQCSDNIKWWLSVTRSSEGTSTSATSGFLTFRRRNDNTVLVNLAANLFSQATYYVNPCPLCCFTPETPITMYDMSTKAIALVQIGDVVLARGGKTKTITGIITVENRVMYRFRFADGRVLDASEDHPLYVVGKGYASMNPTIEYKELGIPAKIAVGDFVVDQNGVENEILSITDLYYPHTVYTFNESEFYANGMLVY